MPPQSTGSFGAAAGGVSPELQAAIQRRAGASATPVTQGAPGFNPATQPAPAPTGQAPQPQMGVPSQPVPQQAQQPQPAQPTMPFDPAELKMVTGALVNRLKTLGTIQSAMVGIPPEGS